MKKDIKNHLLVIDDDCPISYKKAAINSHLDLSAIKEEFQNLVNDWIIHECLDNWRPETYKIFDKIKEMAETYGLKIMPITTDFFYAFELFANYIKEYPNKYQISDLLQIMDTTKYFSFVDTNGIEQSSIDSCNDYLFVHIKNPEIKSTKNDIYISVDPQYGAYCMNGIMWHSYSHKVISKNPLFNLTDEEGNKLTDYDGYKNTKRILKHTINKFGHSYAHAAKLASNLQITAGNYEYNGYLPAISQLKLICMTTIYLQELFKSVGKRFPLDTTGWFWCSTEHDDKSAWIVSHHVTSTALKQEANTVLPVFKKTKIKNNNE